MNTVTIDDVRNILKEIKLKEFEKEKLIKQLEIMKNELFERKCREMYFIQKMKR
jgi:hypothetical protein